MPNFCGGLKLNSANFKVVDGVICSLDTQNVDLANTISVCGQLWDGSSFKAIHVNGRPVITVSDATEIPETVIRSNCGIGLDGRYFQVLDDNTTALVASSD